MPEWASLLQPAEDEQDSAFFFVCELQKIKDELPDGSLASLLAIQKHIVTLAIRKLFVAMDSNIDAFLTIETEQKRLAAQGLTIIQREMEKING
jgi:hypothetical protein